MSTKKRVKLDCKCGYLSSIYQPGRTLDTVIFLHDLGRECDDFLPLLEKIKTFETYAIDILGFGESSKPEESDYSLETLVQTLFESLSKTSSAGGYQIVGTGLGLVLGSLMAKARPDLIKSIIGVGLGSLRSNRHNELMPISKDENTFGRSELPVWIAAQKSRGEITKGLEATTSYSYFRTAHALKEHIEAGSLLSTLASLKQPKYIIHGDLDQETLNLWPQQEMNFVKKYIPLTKDNPLIENLEHTGLTLEILISANSSIASVAD